MRTFKATAGAAALCVVFATAASAQFLDFHGRVKKAAELRAVFGESGKPAEGVLVGIMAAGEALAADILPEIDLLELHDGPADARFDEMAPEGSEDHWRDHSYFFECEMGEAESGSGVKTSFQATWKGGKKGIKGAKVSVSPSSPGAAGVSVAYKVAERSAHGAIAGAAALTFDLLSAGGQALADGAEATLTITADGQAAASCAAHERR